MIHLFKFLMVVFCAFSFITDVHAGLPMIVRAVNQHNTPIPNIVIETVNLAKQDISLKSDKNGKVNFADKCTRFKNAYNPQKKQGVKICAVDTSGDYKKACIIVTNQSNCDETIRMELAPLPAGKKYPSAEQMKKLALNKKGNLLLYPVCNSSYTNYPTDVTKHCVNDFFKSTDVQMLEAEALAKIYAKQQHNQTIVCGRTYRTEKNDDYLKCTSNDAKHVYEFRFDDLDEPIGKTIQNDTANALCRLPGGKYDNNYSYCKKDNQTQQICSGIDTNAQKFGWNAKYYQSKVVATHTTTLGNGSQHTSNTTVNDICSFDFQTKWADNYQPKTYADIDPFVFQQLQVKSNRDVILLLHQYVLNKIGAKFKSINCDSGFKIFYRTATQTDDLITCHLTTVDNKTHDIDFVFDDVNEKSKTKTDGGLAGMQCISNSGQFDGKNCVGIGRIQCAALNYKLPGGTRFNKKLGICELKAAQKADDLAKFERGITIAGTAVVGVALTVASGGTGAALVVGLVATGIGSVSSGVKEVLQNIQNEFARDFVVASEQCPAVNEECTQNICKSRNCNPDSNCAKETILSAYGDIKNMVSNAPADQLTQAVTYAHDTTLSKITEGCIDDDFENKYQNASSGIGTAIEIADWTSLAADVVSISAATKAGSSILLKLGAKASGSGKAFTIGVKNPKALRVLKKLSKTNDYRSAFENTKNKTK